MKQFLLKNITVFIQLLFVGNIYSIDLGPHARRRAERLRLQNQQQLPSTPSPTVQTPTPAPQPQPQGMPQNFKEARQMLQQLGQRIQEKISQNNIPEALAEMQKAKPMLEHVKIKERILEPQQYKELVDYIYEPASILNATAEGDSAVTAQSIFNWIESERKIVEGQIQAVEEKQINEQIRREQQRIENERKAEQKRLADLQAAAAQKKVEKPQISKALNAPQQSDAQLQARLSELEYDNAGLLQSMQEAEDAFTKIIDIMKLQKSAEAKVEDIRTLAEKVVGAEALSAQLPAEKVPMVGPLYVEKGKHYDPVAGDVVKKLADLKSLIEQGEAAFAQPDLETANLNAHLAYASALELLETTSVVDVEELLNKLDTLLNNLHDSVSLRSKSDLEHMINGLDTAQNEAQKKRMAGIFGPQQPQQKLTAEQIERLPQQMEDELKTQALLDKERRTVARVLEQPPVIKMTPTQQFYFDDIKGYTKEQAYTFYKDKVNKFATDAEDSILKHYIGMATTRLRDAFEISQLSLTDSRLTPEQKTEVKNSLIRALVKGRGLLEQSIDQIRALPSADKQKVQALIKDLIQKTEAASK